MVTLLDVLKKRLMSVVLWQALFVGAVIAIPVSNWFIAQACLHPLRFVMLNSRDTFYLSSGGTFEDAKAVHIDYAKLAAQTLFDRQPAGLDSPERLDRLFNSRTEQQVNDDIAKDSDLFRLQQLHQKIEIGRIREVQLDASSAAFEITGQVIRTGYLGGQVTQTRAVVMDIKLMANDEIESNHKFPMVVWDYQVIWQNPQLH
jgi:hypothetical protein